MNKPMTKEELFEVETACGEAEMERLFRRLVESEAFWREAVKNAKHTIGDANDICIYTMQHVRMCGHLKCPWLLAQES